MHKHCLHVFKHLITVAVHKGVEIIFCPIKSIVIQNIFPLKSGQKGCKNLGSDKDLQKKMKKREDNKI